MYHSITFGDKNTWDDWHLVPSSRLVFNPPKQKTVYMDIPGADGVDDLSELLSKCPTYNNREGSFEFVVMNGYGDWQDRYSDIMDYLHGQVRRAVLEDDPCFYYEGRFSVNEWKSDKNWSRIVIDYNVAPYKLLKYSSVEDWRWDDIDFEQNFDLIGMNALSIDGSWETSFRTLRKTVTPVFTVSSDDGNGLTVHISDTIGHSNTVTFGDGENLMSSKLRIYGPAITTLRVTGNGTITIEYRMGRL